MKKEAKLLLQKALDGLLLSIEHFNRPFDTGRTSAVLILLDHALEMFLKAAIVHRGGRIRAWRAKQTIGFDACVRKAVSDGDLKFITEEQALTLQAINGLRDAAQHYIVDVPEALLYMHVQAGVTLFKDIAREVFDIELSEHLPTRVLPLSTEPPQTLDTLFASETDALRQILRPGRRRRTQAMAKLRAFVILDQSIQGEYTQPSPAQLRKLVQQIQDGKQWTDLFPGVASIEFTAKGYGPSFDLRITKRGDGTPITLVPEGTAGARVVAVKRVNELGFYNLSHGDLAKKLGITQPKLTALRWYLGLENDEECFKRFTVGKTSFLRYSQKAIKRIQEALEHTNVDEVWAQYKAYRGKNL